MERIRQWSIEASFDNNVQRARFADTVGVYHINSL
jgi:hypothetical protein